jgi:hypothetical protein
MGAAVGLEPHHLLELVRADAPPLALDQLVRPLLGGEIRDELGMPHRTFTNSRRPPELLRMIGANMSGYTPVWGARLPMLGLTSKSATSRTNWRRASIFVVIE